MGNYKDFVDLIKKGTKLKIGNLNDLFKKPWDYYPGEQSEYQKIIDYLAKHSDDIENIIHPKDHKKLDKIRTLINIPKSKGGKTYPHGYKAYRILKFINDNHPSEPKELTKFVYELTYGPGTFNPVINSSYWKDGFDSIVYPYVYTKKGKWYLNDKGAAKLAKGEAKFRPIKIKAYL